MDNIIEPHANFDFTKLSLGVLSSIQGGAYFTRIFFENKPLYIQTPTCSTKQGFIKHGKKIYSDLMFNNNDEVFINWLENLETKCHQLIHEKADSWFSSDNKLELNDIESAFTSPIKTFKSGRYYLLRVNAKPTLPIYGESQNLVKFEDVSAESSNISILEVQGIKFTSRNFQIEIELKQAMIVSPDPFLESCYIKKPSTKPILESAKTVTSDATTSDATTSYTVVECALKKDTIDDNINSVAEREPTVVIQTEKNAAGINLTEDEVDKIFNEQIKELDLLEEIGKDSNNTNEEHVASLVSNDDNMEFSLEFEDLNEKEKDEPGLTEVDVLLEGNLETITLKKPNHVYYEIYKQARIKAKEAKKTAIKAYLEAKNIKKTYMLEDMDDSDESEDSYDEYSEEEDEDQDVYENKNEDEENNFE
uniref:Uncharacterized protein n=1 Tax=viral metagenome TaxID=1070528 RepID=A0A6C0F4F9_9ZZZZ